MKKFMLSLTLMGSFFYLVGCVGFDTESAVSKNPDAEEVLRLNKNANIFQWEGLIYTTNIDWVNELELTKGNLVGEITETFTNGNPKSFKNGMANKLPIGTKIYSAKEKPGILIVEYNGEEKYFLVLVEG
ncbi:hypothetical protein [Neobacillus mesonae]|uniref:hypothetical protein n=1 Tax=Neobacillus mesonae TaxID=1193713 RepID=UPI0025739340|nr:hypothetical protein [Neobacillus mesonae]